MEQDIFFIINKPYVTTKFLIDRKVPEQTIYNHTSKKAKPDERWVTCSHPDNKKLKLIAYDSITLETYEKYKLPEIYELKNIYDATIKVIREKNKEYENSFIKRELEIAYNNWKDYKWRFQNKFLDKDKLEIYCKTYALFEKILKLIDAKIKAIDIYYSYYQFSGVLFQTENPNSFLNKVNKLKKTRSIEEVLTHKLIGRKSNNLKITDDVLIELKRLHYNGKKPSAEDVLEKLNSFLIRQGRKPIDISSVYRLIAQRIIKNEGAIERMGRQDIENNLLPHLRFIRPKKKGLLWGMDGTKFQFYYQNKNSKYNRLTLFIIIEAMNREIIGYSYDDSENTIMSKKALEMAVKNTGYLPREITCDQSKAFDSEEFKRIISLSEGWGVFWNVLPDNPRNNQYAENFFKVFQNCHCKKVDGYLGPGIKALDKSGRPSPEILKEYLKTKNIKTKSELIIELEKMILDYNNSKKVTSTQVFDEKKYNKELYSKAVVNPIKIESIHYVQLFWPSMVETVRHGTIKFVLNGTDYYYPIYDDKLIKEYNGAKVLIRYNPSPVDKSKIFVFDLKTEKYITYIDLLPQIPKSSVERSKLADNILFEHSKKRKKVIKNFEQNINEFRTKSNKNRENLPPEVAEFISTSKKNKTASEDELRSEEVFKSSKRKKIIKSRKEIVEDINDLKYSIRKGSHKILFSKN